MTDEQQALHDEAIACVYVTARQRLGAEYHSRLTKAWDLLIDHAVDLHEDGSATVAGKEQPEYQVTDYGKVCTCTDHTGGKAPEGLCKHILAVGLYKRSQKRFVEMLEQQYEPQAMPASALPEAPISICMKGTLAGAPGTLVTLRGWSMAEIEARANEVRAAAGCLASMFDATPAAPAQTAAPVQTVAAQPAVDATPLCPDHGSEMKASKFGGWYCPQAVGDTFCKRKVKARKQSEPFVPPAASAVFGDRY